MMVVGYGDAKLHGCSVCGLNVIVCGGVAAISPEGEHVRV